MIPGLIDLWAINEFIGLAIPFAAGILTQHSLLASYSPAERGLRCARQKLAEPARGCPCRLLVSGCDLRQAESHSALPLPPGGRLRRTHMLADIAHQCIQPLPRQRKKHWRYWHAKGFVPAAVELIRSLQV